MLCFAWTLCCFLALHLKRCIGLSCSDMVLSSSHCVFRLKASYEKINVECSPIVPFLLSVSGDCCSIFLTAQVCSGLGWFKTHCTHTHTHTHTDTLFSLAVIKVCVHWHLFSMFQRNVFREAQKLLVLIEGSVMSVYVCLYVCVCVCFAVMWFPFDGSNVSVLETYNECITSGTAVLILCFSRCHCLAMTSR